MSFRLVALLASLLLAGLAVGLDAAHPQGPEGSLKPLSGVHGWTLGAVDREALLAEDHLRELQGLPLRFAVPTYVAETPRTVGTWETLENGDLLWRFRVRAEGARSINFGFGRYRMPAGASLRISGPDGRVVLGPYTDQENASHGQLWTPAIPGDEAVMELRIPGEALPFLELELTAVNHGYREVGLLGPDGPRTRADSDALKSGACNIDVVCPEGDPWRNEIRSAARISIAGTTLCSGTLLNNTAEDLKPYFLTADHCGVTPANASSVVVYWNYETSSCGGTPNGSLSHTQTGAFYRAGWALSGGSDFTLIELDSPPEPAFQTHWAGWDRSDAVPLSAVAIHHPRADEKRISFEFNPLTFTSYGGSTPDPTGTHLRVADWDLGTTEGGSSGGGLWNPEHRLVGQLSGGSAACGNNEPDWFGRFSRSWLGGGTFDTQLMPHLDPGGTGQETLDGRDGCPRPAVDFTASPNPAMIGDPVAFSGSVSGGTPPYAYQWDMNGDGVVDCAQADCVFTYASPYNGNVEFTVSDGVPCLATVRHAMSVTSPFTRVTMVDPNGGEVIPSGSLYTVRWGAQPEAVTFRLARSFNSGRTWKPIASGLSGDSHDWRVTTVTKNRRALIRVTGYDASGRKLGTDRSNASFTIQVLKLTSPDGGEALRAKGVEPIIWETHGTAREVARTRIYLSPGEGEWRRIASLPGNPGRYDWRVPAPGSPWGVQLPGVSSGGGCRIKLVLLDGEGRRLGTDVSDEPFTILDPEAP